MIDNLKKKFDGLMDEVTSLEGEEYYEMIEYMQDAVLTGGSDGEDEEENEEDEEDDEEWEG